MAESRTGARGGRLWLLAAIPALVLCLTGCGGSSIEDGRTVLRFVTWKPNHPEAWEEALDAFERTHPEIKITREVGPHSSTQFHDLLTQKLRNQDDSVDVFLMDVVWVPEFAAAGWALPLEDRLEPESLSAFFPGALDANRFEGRLYGLPLNIDAGLLYYRQDLLEKHGLDPPSTWPELVRAARRVLQEEDDPQLVGYTGQFKQYEGLICNMLELVRSNGGRLTNPADPAVLEAIRFTRDELLGSLAPRGVFTYEEQESLDLFLDGGAVFHRNWPYAWSLLNDPERSRVAGKVGIAPLPTFPGHRHHGALGGWQLGVHAAGGRRQAALEFVRFLTSSEMQRHFAVRAGKAPVLKELYDDSAVLEANPHFRQLKPVFLAATPRPRSPIYPQISHVLQRFLHASLSVSDSDPEKLARRAEEELVRARRRLAEASP